MRDGDCMLVTERHKMTMGFYHGMFLAVASHIDIYKHVTL